MSLNKYLWNKIITQHNYAYETLKETVAQWSCESLLHFANTSQQFPIVPHGELWNDTQYDAHHEVYNGIEMVFKYYQYAIYVAIISKIHDYMYACKQNYTCVGALKANSVLY